MSVQTNGGIARLIEEREIVMVPYRPAQINNASVDVSLGRFAARIRPQFWDAGNSINPNAQTGDEVFRLEDLMSEGGVLRLRHGERVLAHTHEFIGARRRVLPEMRAKSGMGRWGMSVALCAGWGDCGYINRWCLEVMNLNPGPVQISVGTLIGQVVFHAVEEPLPGTLYGQPGAGSYQQGDDIDKIVRDWHPSVLLPKTMKMVEVVPVNSVDADGL